MPQTRRDYLASKGLAIAGARGKFSNEAKAELARAIAAGMTFSDDFKGTVKVEAGTAKVTIVKDSAEVADYIFPSDFRYPEDEYRAQDPTGHLHSMREVCNTCRVSLTNHACDHPTILADIPVKIVRA